MSRVDGNGKLKLFVKIPKKKIFFLGGGASGWGVRVDVNGEVKFWGGSDQGLGWGRWGSMVWGRWVMWGMGDVNLINLNKGFVQH